MRHSLTYLILFTALLAVGCDSKQKQFFTERLRYANDSGLTEVEVTIDYPVNCSEISADSLRYYINQWLGDSYNGDLSDGQALVNHYGTAYTSELEELRPAVETQPYLHYVMVSMECNAPKYISYSVYDETFSGGAHGFHTQQGYTFLKPSGELFTTPIINNPDDAAFQQLLRRSINEYFGPYPAEDWLWASEDELLPLPQCPPYLDNQGVTFIYQPYEIAPYAAGMPSFTIPYDSIKPFLTADVKSLID